MAAREITQIATRIAERTAPDAYSFNQFGWERWVGCAEMLIDNGYQIFEAEAILKSKLTRWAADTSKNGFARADASDLERIMKDKGAKKLLAEILTLAKIECQARVEGM